ncbi:hypothetical protein ACOSP7_007316 [Xanthoceras sorbifolium]
MGDTEKPAMMVAVDDSSHSYYALEWTLYHFFAPYVPNHPFKLVMVHARLTSTSFIGLAGPASADVASMVKKSLIKPQKYARTNW